MRRSVPTHRSRFAVTRALAFGAVCLALAGCNDAPSSPALEAVGPLTLRLVEGDGQSALPGAELPNPLVVSVTDSRGHRVRGQVVNFRVIEGGGTTFAGVAMTNSQGIARERWTLGVQGPQRLEARAIDDMTGAAVTFGVFTATVIDAQAPVATDSVRPNPAQAADPVRVTVTINDQFTGDSPIAGASYSIDGGAWVGMQPLDGRLDSSLEVFEAVLPPFGAAGQHEICARGSDAAGNVSAAACELLVVLPPPPPAHLSVSPSERNFGTVGIGVAVTQQFDVLNDGGLSAGDVSFALSPDAAPHFSIMSDTCHAPLAGAGRCTVSVRFQPASSGLHTASLTVASQHGGSVEVGLSGAGATPSLLAINPGAHDYGFLTLGGMSAGFTFTVMNNGGSPTAPLTVSLSGPAAADFIVTRNGCFSIILAPAGICAVEVAFRPGVAGFRQGSLTVTNGNTSLSVMLTGTGTITAPAQLVIEPGSFAFGSVTIGEALGRIFFVRNVGPQIASSLSFGVAGVNGADFRITTANSTCAHGMSLVPGAQCTIAVFFEPLAPGGRSAGLFVSSSSASTVTAPLTGTGVVAQPQGLLAANPTVVNFSNAVIGQTIIRQVTISNQGQGQTGVLSFTMSGANVRDFSVFGCEGVNLAPGAVCAPTVRFTPTATGTLNATLVVSAPNAGSVPVGLTGTGVAP